MITKIFGRKIPVALIFAGLLFTVWEVGKIHPNENVYFNQLIGGLSGARDKNIPYWGNTYGNVYLQGIDWLNQNVEPNAKLGLPLSTMGNIPKLKLRSDIDFYNRHWSGPAREGEYEIEMNLNWALSSWYSFAYYDTYLDPVYEVKVDNVPILKIWKNSQEFTKKGYEEEVIHKPFKIKKEKTRHTIDLEKTVNLTRITIKHASTNCIPQTGGYISLSEDGVNWNRETERIDYPQVPPDAVEINENNFVFLVAAKKARYVAIEAGLENSCLFESPQIEIRRLKEFL